MSMSCGQRCTCMYGDYPFQRGDRLWTSESDVWRRQILTSKVNPRAERIKFIIAVEPQHRVFKWSKKSQLRHLWWFQIKKTFWFLGFLQTYFSALRVTTTPWYLWRSSWAWVLWSGCDQRSSLLTMPDLCPHRLLTVTIHTWPIQYRAVQRQTAVTAHFPSKQLLLFVLRWRIRLYICVEFTRASSLFYSPPVDQRLTIAGPPPARQIQVDGSILGLGLQLFVCLL